MEPFYFAKKDREILISFLNKNLCEHYDEDISVVKNKLEGKRKFILWLNIRDLDILIKYCLSYYNPEEDKNIENVFKKIEQMQSFLIEKRKHDDKQYI